MSSGARRPILILLSIAALGATCYGGWRLRETWRYQSALASIHDDVRAGLHATAARKLAELLTWKPDSDEARYLLGLCEKARGRVQAASQAWERVPSDSKFAAPAIRGLAALQVDQGRLADAERLLTLALKDPRVDGFELRRFLAPLYWQEGRPLAARQQLEANWERLNQAGRGGSEQAIEVVRLHIALSVGMSSIEENRSFLERAGRLAPADDRVWLGKANLATRLGEFDEAARWLGQCLERRPDDCSVWRARLEWALAAQRPAEASAALAHLPVESTMPWQVHKLAAWFAARRGDVTAEGRALERLIEANPDDTAPLDRLAELAIRAGQSARAAELRRRKTELDQIRTQYQNAFRRDQTVRDAEEMARLAEQLGRFFEAKVFVTVAASNGTPARDLAAALKRLQARGDSPAGPSSTLAEALGAEAQGALSTGVAVTSGALPSNSGASVQFQDDASAAGLIHVFDNGETSIHQIPEVSAGGIGLIDFDGDGWLDVYVLQGGPFPPPEMAAGSGDRLFRNRGNGTFEDVTRSAGLPLRSTGYGHGVAVGDIDNDGRPDLFVTRWRSYTLYRNQGDGTFRDVTVDAGLSGERDWPTSAAFADLDNDGDLDLYVCHYLKWDAVHPRLCKDSAGAAYISCDPRSSVAVPDHLFRNDGGRFTDVTAQAGVVDRDGRGFGVVAVDVDGDNRIDLFVANDLSANYLWRNQGGFRFEEQGLLAGVACNAHGGNQAGMGVAAGDVDGDGRPELAVTNFYNEATSLFLNLGGGQFADHTAAAGLALPTRDLLGFGIAFLDANNDGWLDLMTANGHVNDYRPAIPYAMPAQLLFGGPGGRFSDVSARAGSPFLTPHIARGLAIGDLDNDGRADAVMVAHNEPLVYFHNRTSGGHFIVLALEGTASNRDGVGARVVVEAGGSRQVAQRLGGGSFLSASDPRLLFGLGKATHVDRVEVRWPSGRVDRVGTLEADRAYRVREGDPKPIALRGW
jgi:tetratricopeptide (TPR) repeat protein